MSTSVVESAERYVRMCPTHGKPLTEKGSALRCPAGHDVSHFDRYDRRTNTAVRVAVDHRKGGLSVPPETRPTPVAVETPALPRKKSKGYEVLEKTKLQDDARNVLWVRLIKQNTKSRGAVFVVRWALHPDGAKAKSKTAALAADDYQERARTAYADEVARAKKDGWRIVPILHRELNFVELPKPVLNASAKGKK